MESREIKRLRKRFIAIAMTAIVLVMLFIAIAAGALIVSYSRNQAYNSLNTVVKSYDNAILKEQNSGEGPLPINISELFSDDDDNFNPGESFEGRPFYGFSLLRSGLLQGTRVFTVEFNNNDEAVRIHIMNLDSLGDEEALELGRIAHSTGNTRGRFGIYYYRNATLSNGNTLTVCLNHQDAIYLMFALFSFTLMVCIVGLFITYLLVRVFSWKAIQPAIKNAERQKKFITNASHELKTPLAVIKANTEFIEMTDKESEWTKSTLEQVDRMDGLIRNLVMISRDSEKETDIEAECDISSIAAETAGSFESLAKQRNIRFSKIFAPDTRIIFDRSAARMLLSVLIDNAIKYCDEGGLVELKASPGKRKNTVLLTVSNSFKDGEKVDYKRFFDRFYRSDESHSQTEKQSGYGIGLSVAESIAQRHSGSINASFKDGIITFTVNLIGGRS